MLTIKQILLLDNNLKFTYIHKNCTKFLIVSNRQGVEKYIQVPPQVFLEKTNEHLLFKVVEKVNSTKINAFLKIISTELHQLTVPYCTKLILKGLGYRLKLNIVNDSTILELKLGYNHLISLYVPKYLKIYIKKNYLIVEGYEKHLVGSFTSKIQQCRPADDYQGKGFWYAKKKHVLKEIKKT